MSHASFPKNFLWGTATAAYQIEGGATEGGRGRSIWDTFAHTPGRVLNGDNGDVACDHIHRLHEDVGILGQLGVSAYRLSVSWPRLQPNGAGPLNAGGVDLYDRLLDELQAVGIEPWVTLYHWDLPQALEDRGGWPVRDTAYRFAEYAALTHERFADRVSHWTTLNEPWCSSFLGYGSGVHAPGIVDGRAAVRASHHLLLGHGLAVEAMRAQHRGSELGITLNLYPVTAASDQATDQDAARRVDANQNRWFLDPILRGSYPQDYLADLAPIAGTDFIHAEDAAHIAAPIDFLGVNYYSTHVVRAATVEEQASGAHVDRAWVAAADAVKLETGLPQTAMGWEIDADGLRRTLLRLTHEYSAPALYVTENGAAFDDVRAADGQVHDPDRIAYLDGHFTAAAAAITEGADLRGYFVWSLMDNFEWAYGYSKRFGVVHVDYDDLSRTIKDSGHWFAGIIAGQRAASTGSLTGE